MSIKLTMGKRGGVMLMQESRKPGGSATRWGPLFGGRTRDWAETWESPGGWGTPVYEHVLDRAKIGSGTLVFDCECGAGRFARMAADRGVVGAGPTALAIGHSGWPSHKRRRRRSDLHRHGRSGESPRLVPGGDR
jgi:hypothetical protein